jgi:hypothetical protein
MLLSFKPHAISIFYKCAAVSFPWISPHGVQKIFIVEGSSPKDGAFNGSRPTSLDFFAELLCNIFTKMVDAPGNEFFLLWDNSK